MKKYLDNVRLYLTGDGGAYVKRKGDGGQVLKTATPDSPIWVGKDDRGVFVAYAQDGAGGQEDAESADSAVRSSETVSAGGFTITLTPNR